jgi:tellurium resistance protein TerD
MAISLKKGGNTNLTNTGPLLKNIKIGLSWDVRLTNEETFDLDASVLMVKADGQARSDNDFIYYNQKKSVCRSVQHKGDNKKGCRDGDDESICVFLDKVPAEIDKLIVCASIFHAEEKKQNFGQVLNASIHLINTDNNEEVTRFELSEGLSTETAMVFGEIYRHEGDWKFRAVGQGFMGGLAELLKLHGLNR